MKRRTFLKITLPVALSGYASAAASNKPQFTFGVIADPQYADREPNGTRQYRKSLDKMKTAVTELNKHDLEFVVTLGDVIDKDLASFDDIMPIYKTLKAPRRFVLGNHDFTMDGKDKGKVLRKLGMKDSYYSETHGDWHFIYLDGTEISIYRHDGNDPRTIAARKQMLQMREDKISPANWSSGALGEDQLKWFSKELKMAKRARKRVIIFNHYPLLPFGDGYNLWNDKEVVSLIDEYPNVVAHMNGHQHKGNYTLNKACHYVNFKGMVETVDNSAYAVVRCYRDRIEVDGFETEPDRKCAF